MDLSTKRVKTVSLVFTVIICCSILEPVYAQMEPTLNIPPTNAFDKIHSDNGTISAINYSMPLNIKSGSGISVKSNNSTHTLTISNTVSSTTQGTYNTTLANNIIINSGGSKLNFINGSGASFNLKNSNSGKQVNITVTATGSGGNVSGIGANPELTYWTGSSIIAAITHLIYDSTANPPTVKPDTNNGTSLGTLPDMFLNIFGRNIYSKALFTDTIIPFSSSSISVGLNRISNVGIPSSSLDAEPVNRMGLLGNKVTSSCSNGQILQYQSSNSTWICAIPNTWVLVKTASLGSAANSLDSGTFTGYNFLRVYIYYSHADGNALGLGLRFNSDTGTNYNYRYSPNGAGQTSVNNHSDCAYQSTFSASTIQGLTTADITNISGAIKVMILKDYISSTGIDAGATNDEWCHWTTTTGQITDILLMQDGGTGQLASGTRMVIYGTN